MRSIAGSTLLVRKLGTPGQRELAMGAITSDGTRVLNREIINALRIDEAMIEATTVGARREQMYRGDHLPPTITGRTIIVADDGLATGAAMRVAIAALRLLNPGHIVVAVPVAPSNTIGVLNREADDEVCKLLAQAWD